MSCFVLVVGASGVSALALPWKRIDVGHFAVVDIDFLEAILVFVVGALFLVSEAFGVEGDHEVVTWGDEDVCHEVAPENRGRGGRMMLAVDDSLLGRDNVVSCSNRLDRSRCSERCAATAWAHTCSLPLRRL